MNFVIEAYNSQNPNDKIKHKAIINGVYEPAQKEGLTRPIFKILNLMTAIENGIQGNEDINTLIKDCPFTEIFAKELIKENELHKTAGVEGKKTNPKLTTNEFGTEIKELQEIFNTAFQNSVKKYFDDCKDVAELSTKEEKLKNIVSNLYLLDDHHKTTCIATENEGCFYKVLHKPEYKTKDGSPIEDKSKIFGHGWTGLNKQYDHSKNIYNLNDIIKSSILIQRINNLVKSLNENVDNIVKQNTDGTFNIDKKFAQNLEVSSFLGKNNNYDKIGYQALFKLVDSYEKRRNDFAKHVNKIKSGNYRSRTALSSQQSGGESLLNSKAR
jgi:hypothetical protein